MRENFNKIKKVLQVNVKTMNDYNKCFKEN